MKSIINAALIITILLSPINGFTQPKKSIKAYETFEAGEYYMAIDEFKEAYEKTMAKSDKLDIAFGIAECYRLTNNPAQSELWYGKVLAKNYPNPLAILYYADALKMNQKYEDAKIQYRAYKELVPGDPRGNDGIISCDLALEWLEFPNGYMVEEMKFFNSKYSDFSPAFGSEDYRKVYFTSARDETTGKSEHGVTGQGFSDIFMSVMDRKGKWSTPVPLEEPVNTEAEEGTPVISDDFGTLYFTRCNVSKRKAMGCEIYQAIMDGEKWSKAESLGIASDSVVIAHPAISQDELTLYFVSDMHGSVQDYEGRNSKDIWKVSRTDKAAKWGDPENLGNNINTPGNEVFPFLHADGTLYFSSDGHIGMGGLDIFKATKNESGQWEVENMKYPINSSSDDFGIIFEADRESGYLSSTRKGRGNDDIYSFILPPLKFSIIGTVKNEKTDETIPESIIKSIGSDGITLETITGKDGQFKLMLKPGTDYVFIASKDKFLKGKERETTKGLTQSTELKTEIYLTPIDEPIEVENIFFDFDKADLRPESLISLDKLVETLNENDNITIELGSHTDSRASGEYNLDLSRRRAQSVVNYLIEKGIVRDRLIAKGYGESVPKIVDKKDNDLYPFLPLETTLTESYITSLKDEDQQEMAHFLNRRTEFRVLRTDYIQK
ncbi:MAG TPA: OmpA family protein [Bacteroidales bacterium]|nr:OmpA family protein [Bacteroidales bacterium]